MARAEAGRAAGQADPPDRRPDPRDSVLDAGQPARQLRRIARRRPLCRQRRAWAWRRCRGARRMPPSSRPIGRRSRRSRPMSRRSARASRIAVRAMSAASLPASAAVRPHFRRPALCSRARAPRLRQRSPRPAGWRRAAGWRSRRSAATPSPPPEGWEIDAERDVGRARLTLYASFAGLALRSALRFATFYLVELADQPSADRRGGGLAGVLHRLATKRFFLPFLPEPFSAIAATAAVAPDRQQLADQRMLGQLPQRVGGVLRLGLLPCPSSSALGAALATAFTALAAFFTFFGALAVVAFAIIRSLLARVNLIPPAVPSRPSRSGPC